MRTKDPFTLVKKTRLRRTVWIYRTYAPDGRRLEYSTGLDARTVSKTAARGAVLDLYRAGTLIPEPKAVQARKSATFKAYAEGFFNSDGPYAARRAATGRPFSGNHLAAADSAVRVHLIPAFGASRLRDITLSDIEAWALSSLHKTRKDGTPKNAPKSIRNILSTLSTILSEASRDGLIPTNPAVGSFLPTKAPRVKRDALRPDETWKLFNPSLETIAKVWKGNTLVRGACLVACSTGARLGEVRALLGVDVHKGWIEVSRSWSAVEGSKSTKSGRSRPAPLPSRTQEVLDGLVEIRGEGLLFTLNGRTPIAPRYLQARFNNAIEAIGINADERKARGLSFHCLRVTFNTYQRAAGTNESKLRAVVGHSSVAMTDRYTSYSIDDLSEVRMAAAAMLEEPKKGKK